jgi:hypothetical protein
MGSAISGRTGLPTPLPLANGGTAADTAAGARTSLGLGSIATQSASNVAITGGSVSGITDLAVSDGGTGASTAAAARTSLGFDSSNQTNLLRNGDFELWTAGTGVAPDGWSHNAGTVSRDSDFKLGSYSIKLVSSVGGAAQEYQNFHSEKGATYWRGRKATFGCWVKTNTPNKVFIAIYDSAGATNSSFHTGSSNWEFLTVTRTIDSGATTATAWLLVDVGTITAYFDGAILVEGEVISSFSSRPVFNEYTANTANGLVVLNGSSQLPAVSGALLTNLPSSGLSSIYDYGTSASSYTSRAENTIKVCYGQVGVAQSGNQAITNLPFSSATSYAVAISETEVTPSTSLDVNIQVQHNSASQFTIYNFDGDSGTITVKWIAIGT